MASCRLGLDTKQMTWTPLFITKKGTDMICRRSEHCRTPVLTIIILYSLYIYSFSSGPWIIILPTLYINPPNTSSLADGLLGEKILDLSSQTSISLIISRQLLLSRCSFVPSGRYLAFVCQNFNKYF